MLFPAGIKWLPTVAGISLLLAGCSDTTLGTRSFTEPFPTFTVPGTTLGQVVVNDFPYAVDLNLATQEAYANGDFDYITSVTIRSVTLEIDSSSDSDPREDGNLDDFDFLTGLEVYLQSTINGINRTDLVASLPVGDQQYASGVRTLNLTTTAVDVLDYIELGSGYQMVIRVSGNSPADNVIVGGNVGYRVGIGFR